MHYNQTCRYLLNYDANLTILLLRQVINIFSLTMLILPVMLRGRHQRYEHS